MGGETVAHREMDGRLAGCLPGAVGWQWQGSRVELSVSVQ